MANELQTKLDAILLDKNTNLLPENIKKNVTVLGITGTLENGGIDTSDATATADDIIKGKTAYVNGVKVEGNLPEAPGLAITTPQDTLRVIDWPSLSYIEWSHENYISARVLKPGITVSGYLQYSQLVNAIGLTADKIKKGETILGITGTYEPDYTELGTISPTEYNTAVATSEDIRGITTE